MSVQPKNKSFFSTTAGAITGAAGILTAVVGILGAATQLGWIGSKGDSTTPTTVSPTQTTLNPALGGLVTTPTTPTPGGGATGTGPATTSATAQFSVEPAAVDFDALGKRDTVVTVRNVGNASIALKAPSIAGVNASAFTAAPVDTTCSTLPTGRTCQITVTFKPPGAGTYTAKLVVQPVGSSPPAKEVSLKGSSLL